MFDVLLVFGGFLHVACFNGLLNLRDFQDVSEKYNVAVVSIFLCKKPCSLLASDSWTVFDDSFIWANARCLLCRVCCYHIWSLPAHAAKYCTDCTNTRATTTGREYQIWVSIKWLIIRLWVKSIAGWSRLSCPLAYHSKHTHPVVILQVSSWSVQYCTEGR